ncbi:hypothetical protein Tco_0325145 [Tanacetum coccineum]
MVFVTIHQDTSAIPPMTSSVIDLVSRPDSPNVHRPLPTTATATATTTTITTLPLPPQPQQGFHSLHFTKHMENFENISRDLVDANQPGGKIRTNRGPELYKWENQDIHNQLLLIWTKQGNEEKDYVLLKTPLGSPPHPPPLLHYKQSIWNSGRPPSASPALSISKMKATHYPDVGLEQMVPDKMWIEEECKYDIAAIFCTVKSSLVTLNSSITADKRFSLLLSTLIDQKWSTKTTVEDYLLGIDDIDSPRAITFRDKYGVQMIMRFNEIHKFSDGTLQQIDEVLDYRVKEFRVNRMNPGLDTRFWTKKDVDRSREFMFAIQK